MSLLERLFGSKPKCATCGRKLEPAAAMAGAGLDIIEAIQARPTCCVRCEAHYCLGCAFAAGSARGLSLHMCANCGRRLPDDYVLR